jgi:hypothetical protein
VGPEPAAALIGVAPTALHYRHDEQDAAPLHRPGAHVASPLAASTCAADGISRAAWKVRR